MRLLFTLLILGGLQNLQAQNGLFVSNDGFIKNNGILTIINGDLESSATVAMGGTVQMRGLDGEDHLVNFASKNTLDFLELYGTSQVLLGGTLNIGSEILLNDTASLNILDSEITLAEGAEIVGEGVGNPITGNDGSTISITEEHIAGSSQDFGLVGVVVQNAAVSMGDTQVIRHYGTFEIDGSTTVRRYYEIIPTLNENLDAEVDFYLAENDLNGLGGEELAAFHSADEGSTFTNEGGTPGQFAHSVSGIDAFSIWAFADAELLNMKVVDISQVAVVYPVPVQSQLFIDLPTVLGVDRYSIINILGKTVQQGKILAAGVTHEIDVQRLATGTYFIILKKRDLKTVMKRFIKI